MQKQHLLILLMVLTVIPLLGKTVTPESLSTEQQNIVTKISDSEFTIRGGITIKAEDEFVIGDGQTITFMTGASLTVYGKMTFTPTVRSIIRLADNTTMDQVLISGKDASLSLDNMEVSGVSFKIDSSNPINIRNCDFLDTKGKPTIQFDSPSDSNIIEKCHFSNTERSAIQSRSRMNPLTGKAVRIYNGITVRECEFNNCNSTNYYGYSVIDLSVGRRWKVEVRGNRVYGSKNGAGGITIHNVIPKDKVPDSIPYENNTIVAYNEVRDSSVGIEIDGEATVDIHDNSLMDNRYTKFSLENYVAGLKGGGILIITTASACREAVVRNNTIEGSLRGIWIVGGYKADLGKVSDDNNSMGGNNLRRNGTLFDNNTEESSNKEYGWSFSPDDNPINLDVTRCVYQPVYAQGNYWGTGNTEPEILQGVRGEAIVMPAGEQGALEPIYTQIDESELYCTLDGTILYSRPTAPGVYIHKKGSKTQKIIIK